MEPEAIRNRNVEGGYNSQQNGSKDRRYFGSSQNANSINMISNEFVIIESSRDRKLTILQNFLGQNWSHFSSCFVFAGTENNANLIYNKILQMFAPFRTSVKLMIGKGIQEIQKLCQQFQNREIKIIIVAFHLQFFSFDFCMPKSTDLIINTSILVNEDELLLRLGDKSQDRPKRVVLNMISYSESHTQLQIFQAFLTELNVSYSYLTQGESLNLVEHFAKRYKKQGESADMEKVQLKSEKSQHFQKEESQSQNGGQVTKKDLTLFSVEQRQLSKETQIENQRIDSLFGKQKQGQISKSHTEKLIRDDMQKILESLGSSSSMVLKLLSEGFNSIKVLLQNFSYENRDDINNLRFHLEKKIDEVSDSCQNLGNQLNQKIESIEIKIKQTLIEVDRMLRMDQTIQEEKLLETKIKAFESRIMQSHNLIEFQKGQIVGLILELQSAQTSKDAYQRDINQLQAFLKQAELLKSKDSQTLSQHQGNFKELQDSLKFQRQKNRTLEQKNCHLIKILNNLKEEIGLFFNSFESHIMKDVCRELSTDNLVEILKKWVLRQFISMYSQLSGAKKILKSIIRQNPKHILKQTAAYQKEWQKCKQNKEERIGIAFADQYDWMKRKHSSLSQYLFELQQYCERVREQMNKAVKIEQCRFGIEKVVDAEGQQSVASRTIEQCLSFLVQQVKGKQKQAKQLISENRKLKEDIEEKESEIKRMKSQMQSKERENKTIAEVNKKSEAKLIGLDQQMTKLKQQLKAKLREFSDLSSILKQKEKDTKDSLQQISLLKSQLVKTKEIKLQSENRLQVMERQTTNLNRVISSSKNRINELIIKQSQSNSQKSNLTSLLSESNQNILKLQQQIAELSSNLLKLENENQVIKLTMKKSQMQLKQKQQIWQQFSVCFNKNILSIFDICSLQQLLLSQTNFRHTLPQISGMIKTKLDEMKFLNISQIYSNLLSDNERKFFLQSLKMIQKGKQVSVKLLFQGYQGGTYDQWLEKVRDRPNILVIIALTNGYFIAGFSESPFSQKISSSGSGFLMSITKQKIYPLKEKYKGKATSFDKYIFKFGNNELLVKSNMKISVVFSKAFCYFDSGNGNIEDFIGREQEDIGYSRVEFYQIKFNDQK